MKQCDFRFAVSPLPAIAVLLLLAGTPSNAAAGQQLSAADIAAAKAAYQRPPPRPVENAALVELGRLLFWDPRASASGRTACVSCHLPQLGWAVNDPRSRNDSGKLTSRKSPTLLGVGHLGSVPNGWDGRNVSLEAQAKASIATGSMSMRETDNAGEESKSSSNEFGAFRAMSSGSRRRCRTRPSTSTRWSRRSPPMRRRSSLDPLRSTAGSTATRRRFRSRPSAASRCSTTRRFARACHVGWRFTDDGFHDIGTSTTDLGRGREVKNDPQLQYAFKTPTLRSVALRAPYMHNGSRICTMAAGRPRRRDQALRKGWAGASQPVADDDAGAAR